MPNINLGTNTRAIVLLKSLILILKYPIIYIQIINEIEKNDKCYHELLNKDKIIKFKVDIDGTDIELEEIDTSSAK